MNIAMIEFSHPSSAKVALAIKRANMEPLPFFWDEPVEKLLKAEGFILTGRLTEHLEENIHFQKLIDHLKIQNRQGKSILGIGDAATLLLEHGLIPGLFNDRVGIKLVANPSESSQEVLVRVSDDYQYNAFTRHLHPRQILTLPLTAIKSRFIIPPGLLIEMKTQGLHVFQYCNEKGDIIPSANPTESIDNIAAVSNKAGNVMAIIPHPEKSPDGDAIFKSMHDHIASQYVEQVAPLYYWPR